MNADYVTKKAVSLIKALHNPPIGAMEFCGGWQKERCDAILFSSNASFMIETKISRSDFLADKKKDFRNNPDDGIGKYRYYACPDGMIKPDELPEKWGLIYVLPNNARAKMVKGYGGSIKTGEHKCPVNGWTVNDYEKHGCPEIRDLDWNDPNQPSRFYSFGENSALERAYIFALATRYKSRKFMEKIL